MSDPEKLIEKLKMIPHPEGGYFSESFRDIDNNVSLIYYLLKKVDDGDMSVKSAHDEAMGKNKVKVITSNNLDRDWTEIYTNDVYRFRYNI